MAQCLGLYVEENIIKYAKVSKDHDNIKIESFGIKFYENLTNAINQIIEETYSYMRKCILILICFHYYQKRIYKKL